tara:strand:- start:313 stop:522 length:210 start_codon:yes stop_codon:yes gene_type:complete
LEIARGDLEVLLTMPNRRGAEEWLVEAPPPQKEFLLGEECVAEIEEHLERKGGCGKRVILPGNEFVTVS